MANWSNPTLTSLYTDFVTEVKNRDVDLALGLDPATTSPTNVPTNAIRWNSASFKYQKWDGSTWNDLSTKYIFTAVEVSGSTVPVNGMYLSTTNTLNFSTASTASRLTIDGSGNVNIDSGTFYVDAVNNRVGVGETSLTNRFHIKDTQNTVYSSSNTLAGGVIAYIKNASTTDSTDATIRLEATGSGNIAAASLSAVHTGDGSSAFTVGTRSAAGSITERARIDSSGYMQGTVNGLGAGRIPAKQYYRLDSAFTGTNGTAAQPIYGVGVTLIGSTVYEFEAIYAFSRSTGSTSHTMSFLFGGTATINNIFYTGVGPGEGALPPLSTYDGAPASFVATSAGASVATAAMTIGAGIFYIVKGTVSINAGGTFIPQYQLSAAPGGAYSTYAGAYFSIWPLAASGAAVNIGSWA
jgi:hypothetical protein